MSDAKRARQLPAVHELAKKAASGAERHYPLGVLTEVARDVLESWRRAILEQGQAPPELNDLVADVRRRVEAKLRLNLRPVINATGVVLHTNLGRAPLSADACAAIGRVARGYCNLEYDLETGQRGSRYSHVERLLTALTGAEAALVVNNNAAAVLLVLHSLARGREVVVSRGELVEIGGSFRIPEVMAQSGAILKEVGATNKTHPRDYERAIGPETAMLLKVHPSNYRIVGFTRQVTNEELVSLAAKHQVPVVEDLGSGALIDLHKLGVGPEPTVQDSLAAGVDIVTFSGDKLLGGPQAGLIVGRAEQLRVLKENPLLRALRVDKFTLAALEATLQAYLKEEAEQVLPVLRMLTTTPVILQRRAGQLQKQLTTRLGMSCSVSLRRGFSRVGGGALPMVELPTSLVELRLPHMSAATLSERLRQGNPPVLVRVQDDCVLLDPRTVSEEEAGLLLEAVASLIEAGEADGQRPEAAVGEGAADARSGAPSEEDQADLESSEDFE
ncbi:MAG: L-seryl-tRNA(Sec) selenium transferase [Thermacetogeniaceae bacterium]